ncbi:peptide deformylase [Geoalkalibacter ferrihydriticus]|uniref:Peptide deformylase n=2 Tax=Geoalkalibacter ferrihydriticus TaxID=392333 RepID=A0A0C2ECA2_9BACT|nr:peptide deformylase [Geoalkalibacter ferrihydriticus]KIH76203.1 peptide deformylase [Geoalkalibacter ferrihydriticus DSM 17813]SDL27544.1 peptide deformylase [Geoalkalibacter ferrihydriticus]
MAVKEIRLYPDPILKQVCAPVAGIDAQVDALVQDLLDTMIAAGHSVGVAAPQIGVGLRVVVVDVSKSKLGRDNNHGCLVLINPEIIEREGEKVMREGCMSVPNYTGNVARAESIVVQFLDRSGNERVINADGFEAVAIQHEMDHLDGMLFLDRVSNLKTDVFRRKK